MDESTPLHGKVTTSDQDGNYTDLNPQDEENTKLLETSNHGNDDVNYDEKSRIFSELGTVFAVGLPTVGTQISTMILLPLTAAVVGHLSLADFAAYTLASTIGNLTFVSVLIGIYTANETLQPRAFGMKNYREVGLLAVRGCFVALVACMPFIALFLFQADSVFYSLLGENENRIVNLDSGNETATTVTSITASNEEISHLAGSWMKCYLLSVIPQVLFRGLNRFSVAQNAVWPVTYGCIFGAIFHPLMLKMIVPTFGLSGSAFAIILSQSVQVSASLVLVKVMKVHEIRTWPCWPARDFGLESIPSFVKDALDLQELLKFAKLGLGGTLSLSYWWFWECLTVIGSKMGLVPLLVHTIAYQCIPVLFMIPIGISIGLSARMGTLLPVSVPRTKRLAAFTMACCTILGGISSVLLYIFRWEVFHTFTEDDNIAEGCDSIWGYVCMLNVAMFIFGTNGGIIRALGLQWRMAATVAFFLWICGLPIIIRVCLYDDGGILAMYRFITYTIYVMDVVLFLAYATADWNAIAKQILDNKGKL